MPGTKKRDTEDPATKGTLNPPAAKQKVRAHERELMERQDDKRIGQHAGAGRPPLQKK